MSAAWDLVITERDATPVHTFSSDDFDPETSPLLGFDGQDTCNDLGPARLVLPVEHDANDYMTEDNLVHLYVRGAYVTSYIVKVPLVNPVHPSGEASEVAIYQLAHLLAVTEEGIVEPPAGTDSEPAAADRIFDSSDPARDNSDFDTAIELGSVTDAQSNYDVVPYGTGIEYPDDVKVITAPGYGWSDIQPEGPSYYYIDHSFTGGTYRMNSVGDNFIECRVDGKTFQPRTQGFGRANMPPKFNISGGTHRVWAKVENIGPGATQATQTMALEFVLVGANDEAISLELGTSDAWSVMTVPATTPGFTGGGIILTTLGEEQDLGAMTDVGTSFDEDLDSGGLPWSVSCDVSTKSLNGLEQFWVKELTSSLIDIDAHYDFDLNMIIIDAWSKGTHRPASGLTITEGENMGALAIPGAPRIMNQAACVWNNGGELAFHDVTVSAPAGHPVRRRALSLGAARSVEQVERDAASQLDLFNRKRAKPTIVHLTNDDTPDAEMPPAYWKWSTVDVDVDSRWLDTGTLDLVAVTFRLNRNGRLEFTPEASDLIIPPDARPSVTLWRMGGYALGGRTRLSSPVTPLR